jgi:hypothetical protein
MTGWDCEVHLTQAGDGPWRVPAANNPVGGFIQTPNVEVIAARVDDLIIRPGGVLRHREWGLYEVGILGPDGMLVRIGWPFRLMKTDQARRSLLRVIRDRVASAASLAMSIIAPKAEANSER